MIHHLAMVKSMSTFRFGVKLHSTVSHKIDGQSNIMELLMQKENTNEKEQLQSLTVRCGREASS